MRITSIPRGMMILGTLTYEKNRFYFRTARFTAERGGVAAEHALAKQAGLQWDRDALRWATRSPLKARSLRRFADERAERKLKNTFITNYAPPEHIPSPDDLSPKTFQLESAWHCLTRSPAYVTDEAGMGKTITACLCMNAVPGKVLIVCPPFLKWNWQEEANRWLPISLVVTVIEDGNASEEQAAGGDVIILPDSLLTNPRIKVLLREYKFKWLFVDEAHRYKDPLAQRTVALVGKEEDEYLLSIASSCERIVLLSGTPIPNGRPMELYPLLKALAPEAIGHRSLFDYGQTFCGARTVTRYEGKRAVTNTDYSGSTNLKQLRDELRAKLMIRHLKRDHLKELGPKTRRLIFLDTPKKILKLEASLIGKYTLEELMGDTASLGDIAIYRKEIGQSKIEPSHEYIEDILENSGEKVVVFANHIEVVEQLRQKLKGFGALMIRGGMSAKAKNEAKHAFQTIEDHRVIVGNIEAMGTGHTLTRARHAVMVEYAWTPGVNEQAEDRVHRITQEGNVLIDYLVMRKSLDERMLHRALAKQEAIDKVMA